MTRVHEIRLARGLRLSEAAQLVQLGAPTLQKIEKGLRGVTRNTAPKLSAGFGIPMPELYAAVGSPISTPPDGHPLAGPARQSQEFQNDAVDADLLDLWHELLESEQRIVLRLVNGLLLTRGVTEVA